MGCDVMVVVVVLDPHTHQPTLLDPQFLQALTRGLQQRAASNMTSSVLMLLVSKGQTSSDATSDTTTTNNAWTSEKDRLVLQELSELTPATVTSLDLLSLDDPVESTTGLVTVWEGIVKDVASTPATTTSQLVEAQGVPQLLHSIYQSKGGQQPSKFLSLEEEGVTLENGSDEKEDMTSSSLQQQSTAKDEHDHDIIGSDEETVMAMLTLAQNQIRNLECLQEQVWLGLSPTTTALDQQDSLSPDDSVDVSPQNTADFGQNADLILKAYQDEIEAAQLDDASKAQAQRNLWQSVLPPLKQLYDQHLKFLREQYGTLYEDALDASLANANLSTEDDYQEAWRQAAADITTAFRVAAQDAIPQQCRLGQALRDANFDYVPTLEGLLSDMLLATENQQELLGISMDDDDDDEAGVDHQGGKRPAKWYEKVAAKAFVFAVNYFQGWLAYQGIKRAAAQRDAHLPKFPLF